MGRVAASVPGEEAEQLTFELSGTADGGTRLQCVRQLGQAGATRRMVSFFAAAPRIREPEVRRALAVETTGRVSLENRPEFEAWRNVGTDPETRALLDATISRRMPPDDR